MGLFDKITEKYNCDICGKSDIKILMQTLSDGRICSDCYNKLDKSFFQQLSLEEARQQVELYELKSKEFPTYPRTDKEKREMDYRRGKYIYSRRYQQLSEKYYEDLPTIDTLWSVLYNLKDFNGEKAKSYEKLCLKNIKVFKQIYEEFCIPYNTIEFTCVPAYKRLAMLYEKQKKYTESTYCVLDAIQHGVPNEYGDSGSGKMYARLARMAKKAGLLENQEIKKLIKIN